MQHSALTQLTPDTERVSSDYAFIQTNAVLERITALTGWEPVRVISQSRGNVATGKHVVLLERPSTEPGDRMQIALLNSHNGTSSFRLLLARHVAVCSNGIFMPVGSVSDFRIRHVGKNVADNVARAVERLANHIPAAEAVIETMKAKPFDAAAEIEYAAKAAKELRGHELAALNATFRNGQAANTLWDAFNRVQERIIRGGYQHVELQDDGHLAVRSARAVKAPAELVRLNTALFERAKAYITG
jgi:hypothetical protein